MTSSQKGGRLKNWANFADQLYTTLCKYNPAKLIVFRPIFAKMASLADCGRLLKLAGAKPRKFKQARFFYTMVYIFAFCIFQRGEGATKYQNLLDVIYGSPLMMSYMHFVDFMIWTLTSCKRQRAKIPFFKLSAFVGRFHTLFTNNLSRRLNPLQNFILDIE